MADTGTRENLSHELSEAILETAKAAKRCASPGADAVDRDMVQTYASAAHELAQTLATLSLRPPRGAGDTD